MQGIHQRDADGFRAQGPDLAQQRGGIEVRQLRADDHRIHALRGDRGHRSLAIGGGQRLPVFPKIGNEFGQLGRQAGCIPNKQNTHDTFPWLSRRWMSTTCEVTQFT
ncbi:hypothetical protein G6F63_016065 [Rhizopus arrhizus]|nr:hypothetical protein G6F63_016065 [Rhizopus arrhizus]